MVETLSGVVLDAQGDRAGYLLVTAVEEGLEMTGAALLLRAALGCVTVTVEPGGGRRLALAPDLRTGAGRAPSPRRDHADPPHRGEAGQRSRIQSRR